MPRFLIFAGWILFTGFISSCGNIKQLQYLQGEIDTVAFSTINYVEPVIQSGDLISITVYSDNQLASALYNQGGGISATSSSNAASSVGVTGTPAGYLVSNEGEVRLYELGAIKVQGMSKKQLSDFLAQQYKERNLLKNPFVEVRYLNFKITVMGDVNSPGVKTFLTDKVSIFDAIGQAGDLNYYAKRSNILVVREANGVRRFARLDLTKPDVFSSPFYYLQQNDMVIVDPTKLKASLTDQTLRNISITASILSIVAVVYSLFR